MFEQYQPSLEAIEAVARKERVRITAATYAAEFKCAHTYRDENTGELMVHVDTPLTPEAHANFMRSFIILEDNGFDTKAALGLTEDEITTISQTLQATVPVVES